MLHSICQQIWKTQQWPQDWKRSVFIPIPKKSNARECPNYCTIALISHASKVMLKILQASTQQYMNGEFPDGQAGFRKAEEPDIKLPTTVGSSKKQESSREKSALLTTPKPVLITTNCGKFSKKWGYQTSWPASWEIYMQVKKQQLKLDTKQQNGSKLGKEGVKAVYCYPAYLTYMHSTSWEMQGWMNHKLESRLPGYMSITTQLTDDTSYTDDTTLMAESKEL